MIRPPKLTKACLACRERKLKCDASVVGNPCTRCVDRGAGNNCVLVNRQPRARRVKLPTPSSQSEPRSDSKPESASDVLYERQRDLPSPVSSTPRPRSENDGSEDVPQGQSIDERQLHLQMCREIAMGRGLPSSDKIVGHSSPGRDVIEYHNSRNYITILGEALGNDQARRLSRIVVNDGSSTHVYSKIGHEREYAGQDAVDIKYLCEKNAFDMPPKDICDKFLAIFFEQVYPYVPVIDRLEFMNAYESGENFSSFLMQAILASVCPFVPLQTIRDAGFVNQHAAQKVFFGRAVLLYDFGCEKSQLRRLQGSLYMGISVFDYTVEKDFRFWLYNSVRIATRMGLHRRDVAHDMDHSFHKLCRRIWWVIFARDIILSTCGLENVRILHNSDFDTPILQESDWDEPETPPEYKRILPPISRVQKLYLVENCKLTTLAARYMSMYQTQDSNPSVESERELGEAFTMWRHSLPNDMRMENILQWNTDNVWILLLMALSYRMECMFYRTLHKRYQGKDEAIDTWAKQKQWSAMYELEAIIGRAATHAVIRLLPLSFVNCLTNVLALNIEVAVDPTAPPIQKSMALNHISAGMIILRQVEDHWSNVTMSLRLFEWALDQNGLQECDKSRPVEQTVLNRQSQQGISEDISSEAVPAAPDFPHEMMSDLMDGNLRDPSAWFEDLVGFGFMENFAMPLRDLETEFRHDQ